MCPSKTQLMVHFDAEMTPQDAARLSEHVAQCKTCGEAYAAASREWRTIASLVSATPCPEPSADVLLRFRRHAAALPTFELRRVGSMLAGLAALLLVGASLVSYRVGNGGLSQMTAGPASGWEISAVSARAHLNNPERPNLAEWMSFGLKPSQN
jgi:predicted anti-sigma-YlaC factor YlaD